MNFHRRQFLYLAMGTALLPTLSETASALDYPTRPLHIVVGFPPGLQPDIVARLVGQQLSERLRQPVVIDSRPGASTNIGTKIVANASPDGYTLLNVTSANAINASLYDNLNFNFIRDIAPVAIIGRVAAVLVVNPALPARTIPEFIAYAKSNPHKINMAAAGVGTLAHVLEEMLKMKTGVDLVMVPYSSSSFYPDLLGGQVQATFAIVFGSIGYIKAGKLRALGVTSATRVEALPDVPPIGQFVPGFEADSWLGIGAPRNTPTEIIDKLNKEINAVVADPKMKTRFVELGIVPASGTPAQFGKFIADETEKWSKVVKFAGIKSM
jgi:tripartite-type tricarboxylate transporter receptor subunit TctC